MSTGMVGRQVAQRRPDVARVAEIFNAADSPVLGAVGTWLADVATNWPDVGRIEQTFAANVAAAALTGTATIEPSGEPS